MTRPASVPVRRCERCGLAVAGGPASRGEALEAAREAAARGSCPNRAGLQAWIGGSGWSALDPGSRFLFAPQALKLLGLRARPRPAPGGMWQTLLNSLTFGHNVLFGRLGRAVSTPAEKAWRRRLDLPISVLATPLVLPIALIAEGLGAAAGRGGLLRLEPGE
ncbi:MAG: hypothetical protein U0R52_03890 [Solirubrobacterales bacterium]